jgi:hypothetical protein
MAFREAFKDRAGYQPGLRRPAWLLANTYIEALVLHHLEHPDETPPAIDDEADDNLRKLLEASLALARGENETARVRFNGFGAFAVGGDTRQPSAIWFFEGITQALVAEHRPDLTKALCDAYRWLKSYAGNLASLPCGPASEHLVIHLEAARACGSKSPPGLPPIAPSMPRAVRPIVDATLRVIASAAGHRSVASPGIPHAPR